ncbi:hypothetical protein BGW38_002209 [Lunasporangiospora selenospora]|uniref:Peptidase inhibitor family I36 n=1 Tax=Lunasporangiospora selenospora TaxID=979761 RepID=A0A9P6FT16_9FUNG|nr:hypothetical protein BGW38_002209 [Lunasporangiospora selenospora]
MHMSTSNNSWSLKSCLKVVAVFAVLSHAAIADACSSSTLKASWDYNYDEICTGTGCRAKYQMDVTYTLNIRDRYNKGFSSSFRSKTSANNLSKVCSGDGVFCVQFNNINDVDFYYANTSKKYRGPSSNSGSATSGSAEYWDCL